MYRNRRIRYIAGLHSDHSIKRVKQNLIYLRQKYFIFSFCLLCMSTHPNGHLAKTTLFWKLLLVQLYNHCRNYVCSIIIYLSSGRSQQTANWWYFFMFPRKQDLTFHANCLLWRQFAWKVNSFFRGKIRKKFQNVLCWNFLPKVLSVNEYLTQIYYKGLGPAVQN